MNLKLAPVRMFLGIDDDAQDVRDTDGFLWFEEKDRKLLEQLHSELEVVDDGHKPHPIIEVWVHSRVYKFQSFAISAPEKDGDLLKVAFHSWDLESVSDYEPRIKNIKK